MEKIIKKDGYVYLVENWDRKGFEIYYNLGKDGDDPRWAENPKKEKKIKESEE